MYGKSIIYRLFAILFLSLTTAACSSETLDLKTVSIGDQQFDLEIADTAALRAQGLMWRTQLSKDRGMLFIYPDEGNYRIWMKNTLIPLLVVWIDADYRVQETKTLLPCTTEQCPSFGIAPKSRYIIELNAKVIGIEPGMLVSGLP